MSETVTSSSNFLQINTKSLIQRQSTGRASAPTPSVKRTERPKYPPPWDARPRGSRRFVRVTQGERGHPTSSLGNIMMMSSRERGGLCHSNEGRAESSVNRPWRPCGVIRRLAMKARAGSSRVPSESVLTVFIKGIQNHRPEGHSREVGHEGGRCRSCKPVEQTVMKE